MTIMNTTNKWKKLISVVTRHNEMPSGLIDGEKKDIFSSGFEKNIYLTGESRNIFLTEAVCKQWTSTTRQLQREKEDMDMEEKKSQYARTLTVHGLARIFTASTPESTFWLLVFLVGVTISMYVIHGLVIKYFSYKIYTELRSTLITKNIFPGLTVCEYPSLISSYFAYCGMSSSNFTKLGLFNRTCNHTIEKIPEMENLLNDTGEQKWSNDLFHVHKCVTWGNKVCANNKYIKSLSHLNHSCFTLNYNGNLYDPYSHVDVKFQLNTNITSSIIKPKVILFVHDPRVTELDLTQRVMLEPDAVNDLKIEKTVIKRLPQPFPSNCMNSKGKDIFPGKYTRNNCVESILYIRMYKQCGAVLDYHKNYIPVDIREKFKRSNNTMVEQLLCIKKFSKREINEIQDCPVPCEEIEYTTIPSVYSKKLTNITNKTWDYHFQVQYQPVDSYKTIEEKQLFTWDQVAGEVGGFLGLVIGASFISIIEILFYFTLCVISNARKLFFPAVEKMDGDHI